MKSYQLIYSVSFRNSLIQLISEWENELFLSEEKIKHFVQLIYRSLELLKLFPKSMKMFLHYMVLTFRLIES